MWVYFPWGHVLEAAEGHILEATEVTLKRTSFQNATTYRSVKLLRKMILKVKPYFSGLPETIAKMKSEYG